MRCASVRCASAILWISSTRSGLGGCASDELTENETASRGTNHRSDIGSYHLPIFISTTLVRFALSMCSSQTMQGDCGVPILDNALLTVLDSSRSQGCNQNADASVPTENLSA